MRVYVFIQAQNGEISVVIRSAKEKVFDIACFAYQLTARYRFSRELELVSVYT
jgi:hypothetical protein